MITDSTSCRISSRSPSTCGARSALRMSCVSYFSSFPLGLFLARFLLSIFSFTLRADTIPRAPIARWWVSDCQARVPQRRLPDGRTRPRIGNYRLNSLYLILYATVSHSLAGLTQYRLYGNLYFDLSSYGIWLPCVPSPRLTDNILQRHLHLRFTMLRLAFLLFGSPKPPADLLLADLSESLLLLLLIDCPCLVKHSIRDRNLPCKAAAYQLVGCVHLNSCLCNATSVPVLYAPVRAPRCSYSNWTKSDTIAPEINVRFGSIRHRVRVLWLAQCRLWRSHFFR